MTIPAFHSCTAILGALRPLPLSSTSLPLCPGARSFQVPRPLQRRSTYVTLSASSSASSSSSESDDSTANPQEEANPSKDVNQDSTQQDPTVESPPLVFQQTEEQSHDKQKEQSIRALADLIDFPTVFTFKVIGLRQGEFAVDMRDSVANALELDSEFVKMSFRDNGKYRSVTLDAPCTSAEQIYSVYAAVSKDPRVKFKF
mmetsp:Transcript_4975/g.9106  ORF Transcript_4975/g.9106 Transcript_4975/m.9106 type:complete len:201 (+) Transcript_4975:130-732(+)